MSETKAGEPEAIQVTPQGETHPSPRGKPGADGRREVRLSRAFLTRLIERHREALERLAKR